MEDQKENEIYQEFIKADAIETLNRTIQFKNNLINKTSIFIGTFGILLTIIFSDGSVAGINRIIGCATKSPTSMDVIYLFGGLVAHSGTLEQ